MRKTHGIDLVTAFSDFLRDVKDDFLVDPLLYTDLAAAKDDFRKDVAAHLKTKKCFDPRRKNYDELELPKNGKLYRHVIIPYPVERIIYLGFMRNLAPKIDAVLRGSLYSYRVAPHGQAHDGIFTRHADQWRAFDQMQDAWISDPSIQVVVETDISNYYEQIGITKFREEIESLANDANASISPLTFDDFMNFVKGLTPYEFFGVPQNYDPSSFFCSAFLHGIDVKMDSKYRYVRYVDDIRIAAKSLGEARSALRDLAKELRSYRLFLNSAKTHFHERNNGKLDGLRRYEDEAQIIRDCFEECTKQSLEAGYGKLQDLVNKLLSAQESDERKLRFCLNRFVELKSFRNIRINRAKTIKQRFLSSLNDCPVRLDHFIRYLAEFHDDNNTLSEVTGLLGNEERIHYDWVRMWLWEYVLRSQRRKLPDNTFQLAKQRFAKLIDGQSQEYAELAKIVLVLGRYGGATERRWVRDSYAKSDHSYVLQRHFLIACRALPSAELNKFMRHVSSTQKEHRFLCKYLQGSSHGSNGARYTAFKRAERARVAKDGTVKLIRTLYGLEDY